MKSTLAASLSLLGLACARPAATDDPVRVLPPNWKYEITGLKGPGCSDFGKPDYDEVTHERHTRLTFGENTMDGSEIYYWFIAMPELRVELGATESTWCEAQLKYTEYKDTNLKVEGQDYRLRLHKNGTKVRSATLGLRSIIT
jgi:hypothetical protein